MRSRRKAQSSLSAYSLHTSGLRSGRSDSTRAIPADRNDAAIVCSVLQLVLANALNRESPHFRMAVLLGGLNTQWREHVQGVLQKLLANALNRETPDLRMAALLGGVNTHWWKKVRDALEKLLASAVNRQSPDLRMVALLGGVNTQWREYVQVALEKSRKARSLLHSARVAQQTRAWAKNPQVQPETPPEACGVITGSKLQNRLELLQLHSIERNTSIATSLKEENPVNGIFAIGVRRRGDAIVLSNAQLKLYMMGKGLKGVGGTDNFIAMHFPVNQDAQKNTSGTGICATVSNCLKKFEGPLRGVLDERADLDMVFTVVVDVLVWKMRADAAKEPAALTGYVRLYFCSVCPCLLAGCRMTSCRL